MYENKEEINMQDIPAVILCGGKGTRMGPLTKELPKPLISIGGKPILWHIMKIYASQGVKNFILCLGYKGNKIKEFFENNNNEKWNIQFIDTGIESTKSERLQKIKNLIPENVFFLAYGDDVANINLADLLDFHKSKRVIVTITAVRMLSPFGILEIDNMTDLIKDFKEKPKLDIWMSGGFMVISKEIFEYLKLGELENQVFNKLVEEKKICAYKHNGDWRSMNTLKEITELNSLWENGDAFWKIWR